MKKLTLKQILKTTNQESAKNFNSMNNDERLVYIDGLVDNLKIPKGINEEDRKSMINYAKEQLKNQFLTLIAVLQF